MEQKEKTEQEKEEKWYNKFLISPEKRGLENSSIVDSWTEKDFIRMNEVREQIIKEDEGLTKEEIYDKPF